MSDFIERSSPKIGVNGYWLVWVLISAIGLFLMALKGMVVEALIFAGMLLFAFIVEISFITKMWGKNNLLDFTSKRIGASALAYLVGFFGWAAFVGAGSAQSFLYGTTQILSTVQGLSPFEELFFNVFMAGFVEEVFWLFTIVGVTWVLLNNLDDKIPFLKSEWVKLFIVTPLAAMTFWHFHVGLEGDLAFGMAAVIVRSIFVILFWGDLRLNLVPYVAMPAFFMIGAHQGNNAVSLYGANYLPIIIGLLLGGGLLGIFMLIMFGLTLLLSVNFLTEKLFKFNIFGG